MNKTCFNFRKQIIQYIIRIHHLFQLSSRNSLFLAASIVDSYLQKSVNLPIAQPAQPAIYAIASFYIAWKFQGEPVACVRLLKEYLTIDTELQNLRKDIIQTEQRILLKIDFQIPTTTPYDFLDSYIEDAELQNPQTRKNVVKSLKILLIGITITGQLSEKPQLGIQIHKISKKTPKPNPVALLIYNKCLVIYNKEKKAYEQNQNQKQA